MARGSWSVDFQPACEAWAEGLDQADAEDAARGDQDLDERFAEHQRKIDEDR